MKLSIRYLLLAVLLTTVVGIGGWRLTARGFSHPTIAEARIGRPLTPFSVAGVARRTIRRCAVGIYYCY